MSFSPLSLLPRRRALSNLGLMTSPWDLALHTCPTPCWEVCCAGTQPCGLIQRHARAAMQAFFPGPPGYPVWQQMCSSMQPADTAAGGYSGNAAGSCGGNNGAASGDAVVPSMTPSVTPRGDSVWGAEPDSAALQARPQPSLCPVLNKKIPVGDAVMPRGDSVWGLGFGARSLTLQRCWRVPNFCCHLLLLEQQPGCDASSPGPLLTPSLPSMGRPIGRR